jgi:HPt (histidine-containing phosphotransfer) domain-containing protein
VTQPVLAREIFDRLRQATANNPEMLIELCRDYIVEARTAVAEIHVALDGNDAARLRDRAHYLKGSSMMMGARELSQRCSSLEQMGRDSDLTGAESEYAGAVSALKEVEAELQRELGPAVLPPA